MLLMLIFFLLSIAKADFIVVGDWGRGGTEAQKQMADVFKKLDPDFIISSGDNFYPEGLQSSDDERSFNWVQTYQTNIPWYLCLGNHDYYGNVEAQMELTSIYKYWNLPSYYYSKKLGDIEFWFIDTTPWLDYNPVHEYKTKEWNYLEERRDKTMEQYKWLESSLKHSNSTRKIIVGHHPLWTYGEHINEGNDEFRVHLSELMVRNNVESYICGHDHNLQHVVAYDQNTFISGAGSWSYDWEWFVGPREMDESELKFGSSSYGFLYVHNKKYSFYSLDGQLLYSVNLDY